MIGGSSSNKETAEHTTEELPHLPALRTDGKYLSMISFRL
jgi:hypothetical protein